MTTYSLLKSLSLTKFFAPKVVTLKVRLNKPYQFAKVEWNFQTNKEFLWFFNNPLPTRCKSLFGLLQAISTSRRTGICPIPAWHQDLIHIMMIMHTIHGSWAARSRCFSRDATKWTRNAASWRIDHWYTASYANLLLPLCGRRFT